MNYLQKFWEAVQRVIALAQYIWVSTPLRWRLLMVKVVVVLFTISYHVLEIIIAHVIHGTIFKESVPLIA